MKTRYFRENQMQVLNRISKARVRLSFWMVSLKVRSERERQRANDIQSTRSVFQESERNGACFNISDSRTNTISSNHNERAFFCSGIRNEWKSRRNFHKINESRDSIDHFARLRFFKRQSKNILEFNFNTRSTIPFSTNSMLFLCFIASSLSKHIEIISAILSIGSFKRKEKVSNNNRLSKLIIFVFV